MLKRKSNRTYTEAELIEMNIDQLDEMAFGYTSEQIVTLEHRKIKIVWHDDLENAMWKLQKGGMQWARSVSFDEPAIIKINNEGELTLDDGHHRFVASRALGIPLRCEITISGNPVLRILQMQTARKGAVCESPSP